MSIYGLYVVVTDVQRRFIDIPIEGSNAKGVAVVFCGVVTGVLVGAFLMDIVLIYRNLIKTH